MVLDFQGFIDFRVICQDLPKSTVCILFGQSIASCFWKGNGPREIQVGEIFYFLDIMYTVYWDVHGSYKN